MPTGGTSPTMSDTGIITGRGRPRTIREVLAFTDGRYRLYTAVHEIGHAAAGLATGKCAVDSCVLTIEPGAERDAYTDIRWVKDSDEQQTRLVLLHGGLLAQDRWMREQGLWTADRHRAAYSGARHDFDAIADLGAGEQAISAARELSRQLLDRHWQGVLRAANDLSAMNRITGEQICDALNTAAGPARGPY